MTVLEVKAAVRARDGFRCTGCGMTDQQHRDRYNRTLDVHRIVPGSAYTAGGCVTLCRACHGWKPKTPKRLTTGGRQVNVRVEPGDYARLESVGDALGLDLSNLVRMVLNEHLAEYEGRAEQIKTRRKGKP